MLRLRTRLPHNGRVAGKRSYAEGCAAAHALDIVGERWALLVVRELILGAKRFTDLRAGLPGVSPNVLAHRLEQLEAAAVVRRRRLPRPAAASVYELTEWGLELEPAIRALGRWGARSPRLPIGAPLSVDALALSLRTMFDASAGAAARGSGTGRIALRIDGEAFLATLRRGRLELVRGESVAVDATIEGDPATFVAVVYGGMKLADAVRSGQLEVAGDKALARRFLASFPLPPRAAEPATDARGAQRPVSARSS